MRKSMTRQRHRQRRAGHAPISNLEAVMLKQTQLMEHFLRSGGVSTTESGLSVARHRPMRAPVAHKTLPIQYDPMRLRMKFGNRMAKAVAQQKHGHPADPFADQDGHHPLYEQGFFQDSAMDPRVFTLLIQPMDSIVNMIPVRPNNVLNHKFAFVTGYNVFDAEVEGGQEEPDDDCGPAIAIDSDFDLCRIQFPYGRLARRTKPMEINELIRRFNLRDYDDFMFTGDLRGETVFPEHFGFGAQMDEDFIVQSAVRRWLFNLARYFQLWMMRNVWTGDPANNIGNKYKEFYGLTQLINNNYGDESPLDLESYDDDLGDCSFLNSDIKDFGGRCVGDSETGPTIYELLQEMEDTLYSRARKLGALPVQWGIFMLSPLWNELTKVIPCQMAGDGCHGGQDVMPNDGGSGLFNMSMREQMRRTQTIELNGRTYPVFLDDTMPYTEAGVQGPPDTQQYTSDIFFVPFTAFGQEVLFWEHIDYSETSRALAPIPGSQTDALGWSDDGRFHHVITAERWCFDVQSKVEPRLVFLAPHLAGRIQDVVACPLQRKPMAMDGAGNYAPHLGGAVTLEE